MRLGDLEEGRAAIAKLLELDPGDKVGARVLLGVLERRGKAMSTEIDESIDWLGVAVDCAGCPHAALLDAKMPSAAGLRVRSLCAAHRSLL